MGNEETQQWIWIKEESIQNNDVDIIENGKVARFHTKYSRGTAVVRGNAPFIQDTHYFWKIKILSHFFGTDTMIGVGTKLVNYKSIEDGMTFVSFLGSDSESYGFSYTGKTHHNGTFHHYGPKFGKNNVIGVHLDMWHGTLEYYLDDEPLGIAFRGLKSKGEFYPMICSTASQCSVELIYCDSQPASLFFDTIKHLTFHPTYLKRIKSIPGFRRLFDENKWIFLPVSDRSEDVYENNVYYPDSHYALARQRDCGCGVGNGEISTVPFSSDGHENLLMWQDIVDNYSGSGKVEEEEDEDFDGWQVET